MAMLMLFYQQMRLQRKKNTLTYKSLKLGRKLERVTKNIQAVQKIFQKKQTQIESIFKIQTSQAEQKIRSGFGSMYSGNGSFGSGFVSGLTNGLLQSIMNRGYQEYQNQLQARRNNGQQVDEAQILSQDDFNKAMQNGNAMSLGSAQQSIFNSIYQQSSAIMNTEMQQQITAMQEYMRVAQENAISQNEEQEEMALLPLRETETEYTAEKDGIELQLTLVKDELEKIKQALPQEAKDAAPGFGLA